MKATLMCILDKKEVYDKRNPKNWMIKTKIIDVLLSSWNKKEKIKKRIEEEGIILVNFIFNLKNGSKQIMWISKEEIKTIFKNNDNDW